MLQVVTYRQYISVDGITGEETYKLPVYRSNGANQGFVESTYAGDPAAAFDTIMAAMAERGWNCRITKASGRGTVQNLRCVKVTDAQIKAPS